MMGIVGQVRNHMATVGLKSSIATSTTERQVVLAKPKVWVQLTWCYCSEGATLQTKGARIYLDPHTIPPHPGDKWTRFVCISDTHARTPAVPDGDILLHAGDISEGMPESMKSMFDWLKGLPHQTKV